MREYTTCLGIENKLEAINRFAVSNMLLEKSDGFFLDFYTKIRKTLSENEFNDFVVLGNGEQRVAFVRRVLEQHTFPSEVWRENNKDAQSALRFKEDGNKSFQKNEFPTALKLYSQSILHVPWTEQDNETLCILLANRSAALYHLEQYDCSLSDIDYALQLGGYPRNLRYKILDRRARCLLAREQRLDARDTFRQTLSALDDAKSLTAERKAKWQTDIQIMISMLEHGAPGGKLRNMPYPATGKELAAPLVTGGQNAKFPAASTAVQLEYAGPTEGRLARAAVKISAGDTLVVEKPHVIALLAEHRGTHCWHCLAHMTALYPCPRCRDVAFCSLQCQRAALAGHHKYECRFLPALWEAGASITCLLALRAISQASLNIFKGLREKLKAGSAEDLSQVKTYRGSDYATFYRLVSHEERRAPSDLLHRSLMAAFLLEGLSKGGYFTATECVEDKNFIGSLLLHNLQVCQFNSHEVSELVTTHLSFLDTGYIPDEPEHSTSVFLGGAVYPTLALFNHSCNPGLVRYFVRGGTVVARAVRGVSQGEEICENYGPIYTQETREARRKHLQEVYWFECFCEACDENWPLFDDIPADMETGLRLKCGECGAGIKMPNAEDNPQIAVSCPICAHKTSILASLAGLAATERQLKSAQSKAEAGESKVALEEYLEVLKTMEKFLAFPPIKDYILCQQAIRKCMLSFGYSRAVGKPIKVKVNS